MSSPAFQSDRLRKLYDYWLGLPRDKLVPDRSSLDPIEIKDVMNMLSIVEVHETGPCPVRLAGTGLREAVGVEMTGKDMREFLAPDLRAGYQADLWKTVTTPCGRRSIPVVRTSSGKRVRMETLNLPLEDAATGMHLILNISDVLETLDFAEDGVGIEDRKDFEWIDIGAGVPKD